MSSKPKTQDTRVAGYTQSPTRVSWPKADPDREPTPIYEQAKAEAGKRSKK